MRERGDLRKKRRRELQLIALQAFRGLYQGLKSFWELLGGALYLPHTEDLTWKLIPKYSDFHTCLDTCENFFQRCEISDETSRFLVTPLIGDFTPLKKIFTGVKTGVKIGIHRD